MKFPKRRFRGEMRDEETQTTDRKFTSTSFLSQFDELRSILSQFPEVPVRFFRTAVICLFAALPLVGQESPLTNQDVTAMVKAGLSPGIIEVKISKSACNFDTSVAALTSLKVESVPDSVVAAMMQCKPESPRHQRPHVWIGANEEWVGRTNGAAFATASDNSAYVTGGSRTTVQTHSEYPDVSRQLSPDRCPAIVITNNPRDADYAITIERFNAGHLLTQRK